MSFALQEGTVFAGRYRIVRCIAMGGMGAVYEVVHLETERRRALKVMLPHTLQSPELRERFKREARVAAQIESEFIVDVFDAGVDDATDMPFLVMELLRGEEVGQRLSRSGRIPATEAVAWLYQAALALDKSHRASIVHRDLKPENLFLVHREHGEPQIKVLDFGIAKFIAENSTHAASTRSIGTPVYMAPEQFRSGKITPAVDIYALGMMAFTLLVGVSYWEPEIHTVDNVFAFGVIAMEGPKEHATERAAQCGVSLPSGFDAWFAKVTATEPSQRFSTATLAIEALAEVFGLGALLPSTLLSSSLSSSGVSQVPGALALTNLAADTASKSAAQAPPSGLLPSNKGTLFALSMAAALGVVVLGGATVAVLRWLRVPAPAVSAPAITLTSTAAAPATLPSAAPASDKEAVKVEPVASSGAAAGAPAAASAAGKPSSAPATGPRKPPARPGHSAPPTAKSTGGDSVYGRD
jgi:serine/threonine protein kinase